MRSLFAVLALLSLALLPPAPAAGAEVIYSRVFDVIKFPTYGWWLKLHKVYWAEKPVADRVLGHDNVAIIRLHHQDPDAGGLDEHAEPDGALLLFPPDSEAWPSYADGMLDAMYALALKLMDAAAEIAMYDRTSGTTPCYGILPREHEEARVHSQRLVEVQEFRLYVEAGRRAKGKSNPCAERTVETWEAAKLQGGVEVYHGAVWLRAESRNISDWALFAAHLIQKERKGGRTHFLLNLRRLVDGMQPAP